MKNTNINSGSKRHLRQIKEIYLKDGKKMVRLGRSNQSECNSGANISNDIEEPAYFIVLNRKFPDCVCKKCLASFDKKYREAK